MPVGRLRSERAASQLQSSFARFSLYGTTILIWLKHSIIILGNPSLKRDLWELY